MTATTTRVPHATEDVTPAPRTATSAYPPKDRRRTAPRRPSRTAHLGPGLDVVGADPGFCRLFGRTPAETCGRHLYHLLHPSAPAVLDRHFARLAEGRCDHITERVVGRTAGGRLFSCELSAAAVHGVSGELTGVIVLVRPDEDVPGEGGEAPAAQRGAPLLSKIDAQVLEGVASGASTVQLAARLHLSRQGVEYHVGVMLRKFNVPNRAALVARAHGLGMLSAGLWPPRVPPEFVK
ncbi:LuxR C-terminal-related transcriptional regulator [Streptomyces sp. NPDC046939]|uniref:LuxR C-terminal-related transcriptional regulator n=1 Tax=Streptomyces sp. NPDC046939 TaxID=3155376 RepID=UPI0033D0CFC6